MNAPSPPVFLIGYRGTGKSTVAQLLAAELGVDAIDADRVIEQRAGKSIASIFAEDGEPAFRDLEQQVVSELGAKDNVVVALGGGAILREATRDLIGSTGLVVWLQASVDVLAARLASDAATAAQRPSLTGQSVTAEIAAVLAERTPLYEACADLVIDTSHLTPPQVVQAILDLLSADGPEST